MKKVIALVLALSMIFALCGCGIEEKSISMIYGEKTTVTLSKDYDNLSWISEDQSVVSVENGTLEANGPGATKIIVSNDGKTVAEIVVDVSLVEITGIFLNQNEIELDVEECASLNYALVPENASVYGIIWRSVNSEVASVDENGNITANTPGQTTIICSSQNGIMATCEVLVKEPSAIESLNENEKRLFDYLVKSVLPSFYNASAMRFRGLYAVAGESNPNCMFADVQGTNRLGGTLFKMYTVLLTDDGGYFVECVNQPDTSTPFDKDMIDYAKINAALDEYWSGKRVS